MRSGPSRDDSLRCPSLIFFISPIILLFSALSLSYRLHFLTMPWLPSLSYRLHFLTMPWLPSMPFPSPKPRSAVSRARSWAPAATAFLRYLEPSMWPFRFMWIKLLQMQKRTFDRSITVRVSESASRLKTAGELKIALAGTSRRSMREQCTSIIDSNTDKPGLWALPTSSQVIIKSHWVLQSGINLPNELCYTVLNFGTVIGCSFLSFLHHCLPRLLLYYVI